MFGEMFCLTHVIETCLMGKNLCKNALCRVSVYCEKGATGLHWNMGVLSVLARSNMRVHHLLDPWKTSTSLT
eukprot:c12213_g1_i1 orf=1-213(-)